MICAGDMLYGGADACQGDSGGMRMIWRVAIRQIKSLLNSTLSKLILFKHTGPLTITDEERNEILIGVASWGYKCGSADAPGVYAKVTSVLTWIDDIVFKDNQG